MTDDDPFTTLVVTALKAGKGRKKKRLGTWRTTYADIKDEKKEKKALKIKMPGQAKTTFCLKDAQGDENQGGSGCRQGGCLFALQRPWALRSAPGHPSRSPWRHCTRRTHCFEVPGPGRVPHHGPRTVHFD